MQKRVNTCSVQEPTIQKTIPQIETLNCPISYPDFQVNNINDIKQHLEEKVKLFRAGCLSQSYTEWSALNSDAEVLETVKRMHINITSSLSNTNSF